jgi:hypothetical protein
MHIKRVSTESRRKSRLDSKCYLHLSAGINAWTICICSVSKELKYSNCITFSRGTCPQIEENEQNYDRLERTKMETTEDDVTTLTHVPTI